MLLTQYLTQHWFWYPKEKIEGINGILETLGWHYKRRGSQQKGIQQQELEGKDPWENSIRIQKKKKRRKMLPEILKQSLENTLEFKEIQTL